MATTTGILGELTNARNLIDRTISNLQGWLIGGSHTMGTKTKVHKATQSFPINQGRTPLVGRRTMTPAARQKLSLAMKQRWAKRKRVAA